MDQFEGRAIRDRERRGIPEMREAPANKLRLPKPRRGQRRIRLALEPFLHDECGLAMSDQDEGRVEPVR